MYKFEESFKEENGKVYFLKERMKEIVGDYDLDRCKNWREAEDKAVEIIQEEITDTSRWSVHKECIFKFNDRFFRTHYSEGSTEMQDE